MISSLPVGGFVVTAGLWVNGFVVWGVCGRCVVVGDCVDVHEVVCGVVGGACVLGASVDGLAIPRRSSNACVP